jgi:membrane protein YdbS with pleckstrin-like domain
MHPIAKFRKDIACLNRQRKLWTIASILILILGLSTILFWTELDEFASDLSLVIIVAIEIVISIIWWIWTMVLIHLLLRYQYRMVSILSGITIDLKSLKKELSHLKPK